MVRPISRGQAQAIRKVNAGLRRGYGWSSANWSGMVVAKDARAINRVSAQWIVPHVLPSSRSAYSSAWIGIDGFSNNNLIQTGTSHDYVNGKASYQAWWEILPAAETVIPHPVYPGDRIQASIAKLGGGNRWVIRMRNATQNWTFTTVQSYSGPQSSAEWIVEAPQLNGKPTRLARFAPIKFARCRLNGANPKLKMNERGYMVQNNRIVSVPSLPNRDGDGFAVRRTSLPSPS